MQNMERPATGPDDTVHKRTWNFYYENDWCGIYTEETRQKLNDLHISSEAGLWEWVRIQLKGWRLQKSLIEDWREKKYNLISKPIWISQPSYNVGHYFKYI